MSVSSRAKRVAQHLVFQGLLEALRGALVGYLKDVTPTQLYTTIKNDEELWPNTPLVLQEKGARWVHQVRRFKDKITPQLIYDWLKEDRVDLISLIENMGPEGKKWFVKQVEGFKIKLWPPGATKSGAKLRLKPVEVDAEVEQTPETPQKTNIRNL